MIPKDDVFTEKENIIGYVTTDSGTLLITDGIWEDRIKVNAMNKVSVDLGSDSIRVPVIATLQNGRKFLLIPIDQGEPIVSRAGDIVAVDAQAVVPEIEPEPEPEPEPGSNNG